MISDTSDSTAPTSDSAAPAAEAPARVLLANAQTVKAREIRTRDLARTNPVVRDIVNAREHHREQAAIANQRAAAAEDQLAACRDELTSAYSANAAHQVRIAELEASLSGRPVAEPAAFLPPQTAEEKQPAEPVSETAKPKTKSLGK